MTAELLINVGIGEVRIARTEEGRLVELAIEPTAGGSLVGNVYLGRIGRVVPSIQAAFVDIGTGRDGFLGAREAVHLGGGDQADNSAETPPISELVDEGEAVLVQVTRDGLANKGAALTGKVTLPGRLLVYAPDQSGIVVSRRLGDEAERARLTEAVEAARAAEGITDGRFIVRTAAEGADAEELRQDAQRLALAWKSLSASQADATAPACLLSEGDPIERALRDFVTGDTERIRIDSAEGFLVARDYCRKQHPGLERRLEHFRGPGALFEEGGVAEDVETALERLVQLPSGGAITIDETTALTAIDVDSGSSPETRDHDRTVLGVNLEAAHEIARQLRLRSVGGLIVIDFIRMAAPEDREQVMAALRTATAGDAARCRISPISEVGLLEMTRARVRDSLVMRLTEPCPGCEGSGRRPTLVAAVRSTLRHAEYVAATGASAGLRIRAAPALARALEADRESLAMLERRIGRAVGVLSEPAMERGGFEVDLI